MDFRHSDNPVPFTEANAARKYDITILANDIHDEQCGMGRDPKECYYYSPGTARHQEYYHQKARELFTKLEPLIGAANVWPVIKIVLGEMM